MFKKGLAAFVRWGKWITTTVDIINYAEQKYNEIDDVPPVSEFVNSIKESEEKTDKVDA